MLLQDIQQRFSDALLSRDTRLQALFESELKTNSRIPQNIALEIYKNNVSMACVNTLRSLYSVVESVIGEACFNQMALDYVSQHPSKHADLNFYGEDYPVFISKIIKVNPIFSDLLYLYDLSKIEWYLHCAYYAENDENILLTSMDDTLNLQLKTSNALKIMDSCFPVYAIWRAHKTFENTDKIAGLKKIDYLVVFRNGYIPDVVQVDVENWLLLKEIKNTTSLNELAEFSLKHNINLAEKLPILIKNSWVVMHEY